ncbi:hypothetical protein CHU95_05210 [Niveispirillum lacus]|uniref:Pvc16 N-terminal domain-containing protein n=1 Tax=Niveispirillum lacus TaxID=1981099 RepID=A0A255Z440_9PROT|nr:DUF4255 domain-containing protein [Niveispirillum lacus]OYQ36191.1 hypothetical protein CHU95_05210 [Niveispirillum lacus]
MLDRALLFIRDTLDAHLRSTLSLSEPIVVLNHLQTGEGATSQKNQNRVIMALTKIEYEPSRQFYNEKIGSSGKTNKPPAQYFNLNIMMAANFDDYIESLKVMSNVIMFFQANSSFKRSLLPNMPAELSLLEIEIENTSDAKSFEIWSALGATYLPSLIYKVRRLIIDADQISGFTAPLQLPITEVAQ